MSAKNLTAIILALTLSLSAAARADELLVSAAASLTNAFQEAGKVFEKENTGVKVVFNFAGSGTLLQQIDKGAPVDVFASADQETMEKAGEKGLISTDTRRDFARNGLVLVTPSDSALGISRMADLLNPEVKRIAIGDPGFVPAGRYAQQALRAADLLDAVKPKLVPGANVRQVLDYVTRGEVDAAFVFETDAALQKEKLKLVERTQGHAPILYPVAVVEASSRKELSRKFVEFLAGAEAQGILRSFGFQAP